MTIHQILPPDPFHHILSFVAPKDLSACCQVSKAWYEWASQDPPWTEAAKKIPWAAFATNVFTRDPTQCMKQSLKVWHARHLNSYTELLDRMQSFLNNMLIGQNGRFRCFALGQNGLQKIVIKIKLTQDRISFSCDKDMLHFDVTKDYFFSSDIGDVKGKIAFEFPLFVEGQKKRSSTHKIRLIQNRRYFPFEGKVIVPIFQNTLFQKNLMRKMKRLVIFRLANRNFDYFYALEYLVSSSVINVLLDSMIYGQSPPSIEKNISRTFLIIVIAFLLHVATESIHGLPDP